MYEKKCFKCNLTKPAIEFYRDKSRSDGLTGRCKECQKKRQVDYNRAHRVEQSEYAKAYQVLNKERRQAYSREYFQRTKLVRSEYMSTYNKTHLEAGRKHSAVRRARLAEAFVEFVDYLVVFERDNGICGICMELVAPEDFHLDHIIPISRGGEHSYENVQTSHSWCNLAKGAKLPEEMGVLTC